MIKLLIIADDFTGALDTGVQFAACGARTRVVTDTRFLFNRVDGDVSVLVVDAETRHLDPRQAYEIVYEITKNAISRGIPYIYKKTDSALRGNIGSELTAVLEAAGAGALSFFPAFPKMGRTTRGGIHYIDNIPVAQSVFGKDPYEPVTCSSVPELIHRQSGVPVWTAKDWEAGSPILGEEGIIVWDAQTDGELCLLGNRLHQRGGRIMAGCAGFAAFLPDLLGLSGTAMERPALLSKLLVVCGSVNPITTAQLDCAEGQGFRRIRISLRGKLEEGYWATPEGETEFAGLSRCIRESRCAILDSSDGPGQTPTGRYAQAHGISWEGVRIRIAGSLGEVLTRLIREGLEATVMVTGGDTLLECMRQLNARELEPVYELMPGIVLSRVRHQGGACFLISKSGGFGGEKLLPQLAEQVLNGEN